MSRFPVTHWCWLRQRALEEIFMEPRYPLSDRELATVLAALRLWQQQLDRHLALAEFEPHFQDQTPLSALEIDAFCQQLNC